MIRARSRRQIIEKLNMLLSQFHKQVSANGERGSESLFECQKIAIEIGNELETSMDDCSKEIHLLEEYCELVYQCVIDQAEPETKRKKLDELIEEVKRLITQEETLFGAIFMPYKASMWDSLESIWLATQKDKSFECIVMPIPYYRYDAENKKLIYCYEGNDFPQYVPITDFREVDLENEHPDVIYIHNPYDDANFVTSVPEKYFSKELKKHTDKLVYVPYYVTKGTISKAQSNLPVYRNMDYMIVQSQYFKEETDKLYFADKVRVFGSPKFDRVINMCEKREVSANSKKRVMLNTSLNCFLYDSEAYLEKLAYIFKTIGKRDDIELVWRPHPLLESTIQSLRIQQKEKYQKLKKYFIENKVGLLDESADVTQSIASCDAYIGESASSVVSLFAIAEKPIFVLNNYICREETREEKCHIYIQDMVKIQDRWWIISDTNKLFVTRNGLEEIECVGELEGQPKWNMPNARLEYKEEKLYFAPMNASYPAFFDLRKNEFGRVNGNESAFGLRCRDIISWKNKLFYLPCLGNEIMEYDLERKVWKVHTKGLQRLHAGGKGRVFESFYACKREQNFLWMTATDTNHILQFDMDSGQDAIFELGSEDMAYSGIEIDGNNIWLAEVNTGDLVKWDREKGEYQRLLMPKEFHTWKSSRGRNLAHIAIYNLGEWIVTIPGFSNVPVKINKNTQEAKVLLEELWEKKGENPEDNMYFETVHYSKKLGNNELIIQRRSDAALITIDIETENYWRCYLKVKYETLEEILAGEDGFEKIHKNAEFSCRENRYFSLNGFLDALTENRLGQVLERQKEENRNLAVNLDGTCGEKVHAFIKDELEKEGLDKI